MRRLLMAFLRVMVSLVFALTSVVLSVSSCE